MIDPTLAVSASELVAGRDYPSDLVELRAWFGDDAACLDYLEWLRWPQGVRCPRCGTSVVWRQSGVRYRCRECWYTFSLTSGTIFAKTRTPLTVWFEVAWLMSADKGGVSAAHLHRVLPINSYQTAWAMLARLRQVMSSGGEPLRGRVEVDESFFGGHRPGVRGRGALGKTLVAGAVELTDHGWGRARLAVIPDASTQSLRAFITANIAQGSTILSDGLSSYPGALRGYLHEPINVSASGKRAHEVLPAVHRIFSLAKRMIEGTYQGCAGTGHLQEYLDEFIFRFNRRHSHHRGLVFRRLLERAVASEPVTYRQLVRDPKSKVDHPRGVHGPRSSPGSLDTGHTDRPWRANS